MKIAQWFTASGVSDGAPEWVSEFVDGLDFNLAEGGDSLEYDAARLAAEHIDYCEESGSEFDPYAGDWGFDGDSFMPYTRDRLAWLSADLNRLAEVSEALEELGIYDVSAGIGYVLGQTAERVAASLWEAYVEARDAVEAE